MHNAIMSNTTARIISLGTLMLIIFIVFLANRFISQEQLKLLIDHTGGFGILLFVAIATFVNIAPPFSTSLIFFAGYYAFGSTVIILGFLAACISAVIDFWIARRWGREIVGHIVGKRALDKVENHLKQYEISILIFLRLFEDNLYIPVSYACGLSTISFRPYIIISIFVTIPVTLTRFYILSKLKNPFSYFALNAIFITAISIIFLLLLFLDRNGMLTIFSKKTKSKRVK